MNISEKTISQTLTHQGQNLWEYVQGALSSYFTQLDGQTPSDLYDLVLAEIEDPLLRAVLVHTKGNQSKAAIILGISRGTLRKKLKLYNID
jgi:Fis family transcriptional regulator, factor for inversion stimulation protein